MEGGPHQDSFRGLAVRLDLVNKERKAATVEIEAFRNRIPDQLFEVMLRTLK